MSTFLDDLERELLAAHPRRRAARRRAAAGRALRAAPLALVVLLTLAGAGAFLVTVGGEDAPREPAVESSPGPYRFVPDLPDAPVAVLNGTTRLGLATMTADVLGATQPGRSALLDNEPVSDRRQTVVFHEPRHAAVAERMAARLGARTSTAIESVRQAAGDAEVVVAAGFDIRRARSGDLRGTCPGGPVCGRAGIVDRPGGSIVSVDAVAEPGRRYGIWLAGEGGRWTFVGQPADPAGRDGRIRGTRRMRVPRSVRRVVVGRESAAPAGARPADVVLDARLR